MKAWCIIASVLHAFHFAYSCQPGQYHTTNRHGHDVCLDCIAGKFTDGTFGVLGIQYTNTTPYTTLNAHCAACPGGKYANASGMSVCFSCAAGKSTFFWGATSESNCLECPLGAASAEGQACEPCPQGAYNHMMGQSSCRSCEVGKFMREVGSSEPCLVCAPGTFSLERQARCTNCNEVRGFQPQQQASACITCANNTYTTKINQIQGPCIQCPVGKYAQGDMVRCETQNVSQSVNVFLQQNECPVYGKKNDLWTIAKSLELHNSVCQKQYTNSTLSESLATPKVLQTYGHKLPLVGGSTMYPFWFEAYYVDAHSCQLNDGCPGHVHNRIMFRDQGNLYGPFFYINATESGMMSVLYSLDNPDNLIVFEYRDTYIVKIVLSESSQTEEYKFPIGNDLTYFVALYMQNTYMALVLLYDNEYTELSILNVHEIERELEREKSKVFACDHQDNVCTNLENFNIARETMESWIAHGISKWVQGADGQNCDEVCSSVELTCDASKYKFPLVQADVGVALLSAFGHDCALNNGVSESGCYFCPAFVHSWRCWFDGDVRYQNALQKCGYKGDNIRRICPCGIHDSTPEITGTYLSYLYSWLRFPNHMQQYTDDIVDFFIAPDLRLFVQYSSDILDEKWHILSVNDVEINEYFQFESGTSKFVCTESFERNALTEYCMQRIPQFTITSNFVACSTHTGTRHGKLEIPVLPFEHVHEYTIRALDSQNIFMFTFSGLETQNDAIITLEAHGSVFRDRLFQRYEHTINVNLLQPQHQSFWVATTSVTVKITSTNATVHMWLPVEITAYTHFLGCEREMEFVCTKCPDYTFKDWTGSGNCVRCPTNAYPIGPKMYERFDCVCALDKQLTRNADLIYGCTVCDSHSYAKPTSSLPNYQTSYECTLCPTDAIGASVGGLDCVCRGYYEYHNIRENICISSLEYDASCPQGTFSSNGKQPCTWCPTGTFSQHPGATNCASCGQETPVVFDNSSMCFFCDKNCASDVSKTAHAPWSDLIIAANRMPSSPVSTRNTLSAVNH
jgi:hypothetical protein